MRYSIEPRTRHIVKGYGLLSFARNILNKYKKQLLYTGLDALKTASKKVFHKAAEGTGEVIGNKIADAVTKSNDDKIVNSDENSRNVEEIIITPEKTEKILNKLRQVLSKWNTIKYISY